MKIFNNTKAMEAGQIVLIVLGIIGFMAASGTIVKYALHAEDKKAEALCYDSVGVRASSLLQIGGAEVALTPLYCKTIDKKVEGDSVKIKQQVAELMARCRWMWHEGRYEQILDQEQIKRLVGTAKNENDCFMCYTVLVDEDTLTKGIPAPDIMQYLLETNYPKVKENTYLDYLQTYGGPGNVAVLSNIENKHAYGIAFVAKNKEGQGSWGVLPSVIGAFTFAGGVACALAAPCAAIAALGMGTVGAGTFALGEYQAIQKFKAEFYSSNNRETSGIVFDNLDDLQGNGCLVRDLVGE